METIKEQPLGLIFILTRDLRVLIYAIKPIDQRTRFENRVGCRHFAALLRFSTTRRCATNDRWKTSDPPLRPDKSQTDRSLGIRIIVAIF